MTHGGRAEHEADLSAPRRRSLMPDACARCAYPEEYRQCSRLDHPSGEIRPHRRAARQSRHAGGDRLLVDAALPQGIPLRPARDRDAALALVAAPQSHHPDDAAGPQGPRLRFDLEQGARRRTAEDDHALPGRQARERCLAAARRPRRASIGRCATASPRRGADRGAAGRRAATACSLVPLYPQYCAATTATACDKVFDALQKMRWQPTLAGRGALA